jgi:uncharacterized protein
MSGFNIHLATLPAGRSRIETEAAPAATGLPEGEWAGPLRAELTLDKANDQITVRGMVRSMARLECVRCLRVFDQPVEAELLVYADRAGSSRRGDEEDDLERDHYMKFHDGRQLDLSEDVRETLLLEVPFTPHCREDCKGLCPKCGADLNEGPCEHTAGSA